MHSKRESSSLRNQALQAAPPPHARAASISANDPPRPNFIPGGYDSLFPKPCHRGIPQQTNSALSRTLNHSLVQNLTPYSESKPKRKTRAYRGTLILKLNASKGAPIRFAKIDSQF